MLKFAFNNQKIKLNFEPMKKNILLLVIFSFFFSNAQIRVPQASPKCTFIQSVGLTDFEVVYSRPGVKGRTIFGDLVPFAKLWRTGANANTTISISDDVNINGNVLKKGKYALYTVPKADAWEFIFYSTTDNWGTPESFEESKVALRTTAKPEMLQKNVESFTIAINNLDNNFAFLEISWEKTLVSLKIDLNTNKTALASIDKVMKGPSAGDYYSAAQYFFQSNGDLNKALEYINKALELSTDKPYWYSRQKSLIQAKLGDKKGAIETAKISLEAAEIAKNNDYVKMNKDSIVEWSKK